MATTVDEIRGWLKEGKRRRATHVIVVCDSFDFDDYPVYVKKSEDVKDKYQEYLDGKHPMQRVMEIYSLKKDLEPQIKEKRAFHLD